MADNILFWVEPATDLPLTSYTNRGNKNYRSYAFMAAVRYTNIRILYKLRTLALCSRCGNTHSDNIYKVLVDIKGYGKDIHNYVCKECLNRAHVSNARLKLMELYQ